MMAVFSTLREKPWLTASSESQVLSKNNVDKKTTLIIFLAVVSVFFLLFIFTFLARSQYEDFQALAGQLWQPFYNPMWLWINTAMLALASILIQLSLNNTKRHNHGKAFAYSVVSLFLSIQFLLAQIILFRHLYSLGFYFAENPANSYFYLLTSLHGIHLLGGLVVMFSAGIKAFKNEWKIEKDSIRLCAIYWHYLFLLWVVLVLLTTSSPETYALLAALCGYN